MQPINDPVEQVTVTVIIIFFVGLLVSYLSLAFWIGLRTRWAQSWKLLGGLSVVTSLVWLILATVISYMNLLDAPRSGPALDAYAFTFGIPYDLNLPAPFLSVPAIEIPICLRLGCTTIVQVMALFALALLPYA